MSAKQPSDDTPTPKSIEPGTNVAFKDPDAGNHADGCEFEHDCWFYGEIRTLKYDPEEDTTYILFRGGPGRVPVNDDNIYIEDDIPQWLQDKFEISDYNTEMWHTEHNPDHHLHDKIAGDHCNWDGETVRTTGQ